MVNKIKHVLGLCVLGVLTLGSGAGFAATCPDPGQYPYNGCSLEGSGGRVVFPISPKVPTSP